MSLELVFDILDKVKRLDPVFADVTEIVADIGKLLNDLEGLLPQEMGGAVETEAVGGPRPHRLLKRFVRNRTIKETIAKAAAGGKTVTYDEAAAAYDAKINNAVMMGAFAEDGVAVPTVDGSFTDWLKSVDWVKVFSVIAKLVAMLLPLLM